MFPFSFRPFPFKRDEQRTSWNYIFRLNFRIRNPSVKFFLCQLMGNCFFRFLFRNFRFYGRSRFLFWHTPKSVCEIFLTGTSGRCLIDSPSIVTLPLAKPASRATACSLGLNDPIAMGVGTPCTHTLLVILDIGVHDKKPDLATLPRTGEQGTE